MIFYVLVKRCFCHLLNQIQSLQQQQMLSFFFKIIDNKEIIMSMRAL